MYGIAIYTLMRNYPFFLAIAAALAIVETIGLEINAGISIALYGMVAMYSHRMILLDEQYGLRTGPIRDEAGKPVRLPYWSFFWRYGVFFLTYLVATFAIVILLMPFDSGTETGKLVIILLSVTLAAPVIAVALALFGTTLPATAVGGDKSFGAALRRGRQRFGATLLRLAVGPGLIGLVNIALIVVLSPFASGTTGLLAIGFLAFLLSFLPTHLVAVVLSMAYLEAESPDKPARG